jgi:hypothetical protein
VGYSHGFYREMAPDWLDHCAEAAGVGAPRDRNSGSFRYLELGSGQGIGLCLLAAANPQAEFVGVDFLPDHIAHSQSVADAAGLTNVQFVEADFVALAAAWRDDLGTFDYVTLHGIYTWVSEAVREAVIRCLVHATRPGSLVYVGYNSLPSWLSAMPFQHITQELKRMTGHGGSVAIDDSLQLFDRLLAGNALAFSTLPALKARLERVKTEDPNYLVQEYLNDGWRPMWHSQVARQLAPADLEFVGSATIVEHLLPEAFPPGLKALILEQSSCALRQDLQDFILNQSFRRDIFRRGSANADSTANLLDIRLRLLKPPAPGSDILIDTSFGEVKLHPQSYTDVVAALAEGPKSIGELTALSRSATHDIRRILLLRLDTPALAIEAACPGGADSAHRLNAILARAVCEGAPYGHLAAAQLGSAIPATGAQMMMLDCWLESSGQADVAGLAEGLAARNEKVGGTLDRTATALAKGFIETSLPRLRLLGAIA